PSPWPALFAPATLSRNAGEGLSSRPLQNEPRQVGVFREFADPLADIALVDGDRGAARLIRRGEADLLEQALEDRVQPARADVFDRGVDLLGQQCDFVDCLRAEFELDAFGCEQGPI